MSSILILIILVIVVCAMIVWALDYLPFKDPFKRILQAMVIIVGALVIAQRAGLF